MKFHNQTNKYKIVAKLFGFTPYSKKLNKRRLKKAELQFQKVLSSPVDGLKVSRKDILPEDRFGGIFPPSDKWEQISGIMELPRDFSMPWDIYHSRDCFARRLQYTAHRLGDGLYYGRDYDGLNTHTPFTLFVGDDRVVLHWYDQKDSVEVWAMPTL